VTEAVEHEEVSVPATVTEAVEHEEMSVPATVTEAVEHEEVSVSATVTEVSAPVTLKANVTKVASVSASSSIL
jgi:hypothetical protein